MKRKVKYCIAFGLFSMTLFGGVFITSCEEVDDDCDWYVYDEMGILTGQQDEDTCKEWAREYDDVTCNCR